MKSSILKERPAYVELDPLYWIDLAKEDKGEKERRDRVIDAKEISVVKGDYSFLKTRLNETRRGGGPAKSACAYLRNYHLHFNPLFIQRDLTYSLPGGLARCQIRMHQVPTVILV